MKPLQLHYKFFEDLASTKKRKNPRGIRISGDWYARKNEQAEWILGYHVDKYNTTTWKKKPPEEWTFVPVYTFTPSKVRWNPDGPQCNKLRSYRNSQTKKVVSSPKYCFHLGGKRIEIQGEGEVLLTYNSNGTPLQVSMTQLPKKKTWDKDKYLELRRKRVKAEKILRAALNMGAFNELDKSTSGTLTSKEYLELLDTLVSDETPDPQSMNRLAKHIHSSYLAQHRHVWRRNDQGCWETTTLEGSHADAFQQLRDKLRDAVYRDTKTYTYEPFDDGRHTTRINP